MSNMNLRCLQLSPDKYFYEYYISGAIYNIRKRNLIYIFCISNMDILC